MGRIRCCAARRCVLHAKTSCHDTATQRTLLAVLSVNITATTSYDDTTRPRR